MSTVPPAADQGPRTPEADVHRSIWQILAIAGVVTMVLAYLAALVLYAGSTSGRALEIPADAPPGGVAVTLHVLAVEPTSSALRGRLEIDPVSSMLDDTGRLVHGLTIVSTASPQEILIPEGRRPTEVDVTLFMDGEWETYPVDTWTSLLAVGIVRTAEPGQPESAPLPVSVGIDASVPGYVGHQMTLEEFHQAVPDAELSGQFSALGFSFTRAGSTIAVTALILGLMIALAGLGMAVAIAVARGRKRIEPTMAGFLAALLFALIPLRTYLPGAPRLGSWIDILVFFWIEIALMIALGIFVLSWLRFGAKPDPAAARAAAGKAEPARAEPAGADGGPPPAPADPAP